MHFFSEILDIFASRQIRSDYKSKLTSTNMTVGMSIISPFVCWFSQENLGYNMNIVCMP